MCVYRHSRPMSNRDPIRSSAVSVADTYSLVVLQNAIAMSESLVAFRCDNRNVPSRRRSTRKNVKPSDCCNIVVFRSQVQCLGVEIPTATIEF